MKYDIFISYRRESGEYTAKILHDKLTEMGYKVFFDVEALRSGQFNTKLFSVIDECTDFISVLSPGCLDRCSSEDDWVRLEVAYALSKEKNVVPVLLRGFKFPEVLPEDMDLLRYQSGLEASTEFFDAFAKKLVEFLHTKPKLKNRITQNLLFRKVMPIAIALLLVAGIMFGGYQLVQYANHTFPSNNKEKNILNEVILFSSDNYGEYDVAVKNYRNALQDARNYISDPTDLNLDTQKSNSDYYRKTLTDLLTKYKDLDPSVSGKLEDTILSKADIVSMKDYLVTYTQEMLNSLDYLDLLVENTVLTKTTKLQLLDYYEDILDSEINVVFYGMNYIYTDVDQDYLKDFKKSVLTELPDVYDGQEWSVDKEEIDNRMSAEFTQMENAMDGINGLVGELNRQNMELAAEAGIGTETDNTGEAQETDSSAVITPTPEPTMTPEEVDELLAQLKEQYKPLETDEMGMLWAKAERFNTLQMYDMCIECLELYKTKDKAPEAEIFVPIAEAFYNQVEESGIFYGCIVVGYEEGKPKNSVYQIGDIMINMNGTPITSSDVIGEVKKMDDENNVTILRYNGSTFDQLDVVIPAGESQVYIYPLSEKLE